jgi:hypothetical protein
MQQTISLASGEFRVRLKKTQDPDQMMPVQSLLNRQHNACPTATATATHPMEEALRKMKIMRVGIIKSIRFKFLTRKRLLRCGACVGGPKTLKKINFKEFLR